MLAGGGRSTGVHPGCYFLEPTVLGGVQPGMRVAQEEVFGPVLSVLECGFDRPHRLQRQAEIIGPDARGQTP